MVRLCDAEEGRAVVPARWPGRPPARGRVRRGRRPPV